MTKFLASNNAATTLAGNVNTSQTTIAVATGTGVNFPNPAAGQAFAITVFAALSTSGTPDEIMYVTGVSGDTFTVMRAQEGTSAQTWSVGDKVSNFFTAGVMQSLAQLSDVQVQGGNYAQDGGTANAGTVTLSPVPASLAAIAGAPVTVRKTNAANTGPYTINVNAIGVTTVQMPNGDALWANALPANGDFTVRYDNALAVFQLTSPPAVLKPNSVLNAMLAQAGALTILSNLTGSTGNVAANSLNALLSALGFSVVTNSHGTAIVGPGFIINMGQTPSPISQNSGATVLTYPVPFATGLFANPQVSKINPSAATFADYWPDYVSSTLTTITVMMSGTVTGSAGSAQVVSYIAIGV